MVDGLPSIKISNGPCIGYVVEKHPERNNEKGKEMRATQVLGLVHPNIIGHIHTLAYGGSRYVLTLIDNFSRFCWVYFLKLNLKSWRHLRFGNI